MKKKIVLSVLITTIILVCAFVALILTDTIRINFKRTESTSKERYVVTINDNDNDGIIGGSVFDTQTQKTYNIISFDDNSNNKQKLYVVNNDDYIGLFDLTNDRMFLGENGTNLSDVSCKPHNDMRYSRCSSGKTTILKSEYGSYSLFSLSEWKLITNGDSINEVKPGYYINTVNFKHLGGDNEKESIINDNGERLLENDHIAYSDGFGFVVIDNQKYSIYNENLKDTGLTALKEGRYVSSDLIFDDIVKEVDIKNNEFFKYDGSEFSGKKIILMDNLCMYTGNLNTLRIWVLEDGKATYLSVTKKDGYSNTEYCDW